MEDKKKKDEINQNLNDETLFYLEKIYNKERNLFKITFFKKTFKTINSKDFREYFSSRISGEFSTILEIPLNFKIFPLKSFHHGVINLIFREK